VQRSSTTVVCLAGGATAPLAEPIGRAANVRVVLTDPDAAPLDRASAATQAAAGAHIPYLVHDADPLAGVVDAWVRYFDERGPVGELEVAVTDVLARWRAGSLDLPDYYLVVEIESLTATRRHWFGGVLHGDAPTRVVLVAARPTSVIDALGRLVPGRWWSPLDRLLTGVERRVPDHVNLPGA
jgi:hypothetical protein